MSFAFQSCAKIPPVKLYRHKPCITGVDTSAKMHREYESWDTFMNPLNLPLPYRVPGVPPCRFRGGNSVTTFSYKRDDGSSPPMVLMFFTPSHFVVTMPLDDFNGTLDDSSIAEVHYRDRGDKGFNFYYTSLPPSHLMRLIELLSNYSYMLGDWELAPGMYTEIH